MSLGCFAVYLPAAGAATDVSRGTAHTSISLATLSFTSPTSTSASDVTTTVNLGAGSGFATSDPARNSLSRMTAFFNLVAASTAGVTQISTPSFDSKAESDSAPSSDSKADQYQPVTSESLLLGGITVTALSAQVDPRLDAVARSPLAKAGLGDGLMDVDIGAGLVSIKGAHIAISSVVDTASAQALQGIEIASLNILPLGELFARVGGLDPSEVADQLLALAGSFGGPAVQGAGDDVTAARDDALATINGCLSGVDPAVCVPLTALGLTSLPSNTSVQGILDYTESFAASCATLLAGLGALATAVCADVVPVVTGAAASLPGLLQDLLDLLVPQSLLSVTNLVAGVGANATDVTSSAIAEGGWDSAVVLGNNLGGVTDTADPSTALNRIDAELDSLVTLLAAFPQLAGLTIGLDPLYKEPMTGTEGDYKTARSQLSVLRLLVQLPGVSIPAQGVNAAAVGDPFTLDARLFTLAGYAEHRPASGGRPGSCSSNCMAATGSDLEGARLVAGLMLLALGFGLRRWLGDAA